MTYGFFGMILVSSSPYHKDKDYFLDPFQKSIGGVGELMSTKYASPSSKTEPPTIGICGEVGGDPSISFFPRQCHLRFSAFLTVPKLLD